ncbi:MAG: ABC transporter substrate-binding protein [Coriobacteriia bacterium]|nr:ABC transporter substrate-binding protein [Coriobacteriia bacterium]MCL2750744.1 ABC transporter substrate-binding protein [Coriobacteriia bacterium]
MFKKKKLLSIFVSVSLALILSMSLFLAGCNGGGSEPRTDAEMINVTSGVLTIGSDCDYPPFVQMQGDKPVGFEPEILQAIADELGLELEYLPPQNFDTILASVASGTKMDVGASSFTITDERKQLVSFSLPYFDSNQAAVALISTSYTSAMDFDGLTVGAQSGTTGADWVRENLTGSGTTLKEFNQASELMASLAAGDIQAAFFDEPAAAQYVATSYTNCHIVEVIPTGEQYGFAVSKDNPGLLQAINDAMISLKKDGTFDRIFLKYFPDLKPPSLGT